MKITIVLVCLLLAACASDQPGPATYIGVDMPAECVTADPKWIDLPDKDVTRSELARNYAANKERYRALIRSRRVCRAGVEAPT